MHKVNSQAFKYTVISYIGYLLGIISTIFLYSSELEFYGILRYILAISLLLTSFFTLGLNASIVKFYHNLKDKGLVNSFMSFSIIGISLFSIIGYFLLIFFKNIFISSNLGNFWDLKNFIFPMILLYSLNSLFYSFLSNFYITAIPNIFDSLLPKINTIIAFLFFQYTRDVKLSIILFIILSLICTYILYYYMKKKTFFNISLKSVFKEKPLLNKKVLNFSLFSLFNSFLYATISQIGMVVLGETGNLKENGLYAIILSIIGLINIPLLALSKSSIPLISEYIENRNINELRIFYKRTSMYLFFIGSFLFIMIATNFEAFFTILNKKELIGHFNIIIIIGFSLLIDLLTGINSNIINRSNYYKYNSIFIAITAIVSFVVSYFLVIRLNYGITGAAVSTFISMFIFNLLKLIFNFKYFTISPFSIAMLPIGILIVLFLLLSRYFVLEQLNHPIFFIVLNSSIIILSYLILNYFFRIITFKK